MGSSATSEPDFPATWASPSAKVCAQNSLLLDWTTPRLSSSRLMLDLGERKAKPGVRWFRDGMGHEWLILCICSLHSSDSAQHAARVVGCRSRLHSHFWSVLSLRARASKDKCMLCIHQELNGWKKVNLRNRVGGWRVKVKLALGLTLPWSGKKGATALLEESR